jgi:phage/plasmid-like protein (TIGR03299 family)
MAHNINAYIGREAAWHKLGQVTGHYMTWAEILANGGLDFQVFKSQLHDGLGRAVDAWGTFRWNTSDKARGDKAAATFLGVVGEDYEVIPHSQGFEMIDKLVASTDGAHYETAGALGLGGVVWGLADLGLSVTVGPDKQQGYLLFATGHDGSMAHQYRTCLTRVVCQNTLSVAMGEKAKAVFRVRHTKNAASRLADAHEALGAMQVDLKTVEDKLTFLSTRKVRRDDFKTIMERLFPLKEDTEGYKAESSTRRDNILGEILSLYESNDRNTFPEFKGTAYNLLNAVTEYTDHLRSSRGNGAGRAESALFGSGDLLKTRALEYIVQAADNMPESPIKTVYATAPSPAIGGLLGDVIDAM